MKGIDLIYVDIAFVTAFYEQKRNVKVPVRITKSSDLNGGFSTGFASVGSSMKEQKEFSLDARSMVKEVEKQLDEFPTVNLGEVPDSELPEIFWLAGVFGLVGTTLRDGSGPIGRSSHFQFITSIGCDDRPMNLITNNSYFSSGFDQLSQHACGAAYDFAIRAKLLVRLLFCDKYNPVGAPLLIYKGGNIIE